MEKRRPSEQFPGEGPKLGRMSTHRSGSGSDSVTVMRTSLPWTQKVLEPQIAVEEKSVYSPPVHTDSAISICLCWRQGQPRTVRLTVSHEKRWRRDGSWEHDSSPLIGNCIRHIRWRSQNHLNKAGCFPSGKIAFVWHWWGKMLILHTFNAEVVSWFNQGEVIN